MNRIAKADRRFWTMIPSITSRNTAESKKGVVVLYKISVSLAIVLLVLLISGIYHVGSNATLAGGLFGAFFIFLSSRPSLPHVGLSLATGATVGFLYGILGGSFGKDSGVETFSLYMGMGAFLGAGSILVMSLDKAWTASPRYAAPLKDALILPAFMLIGGIFMQFANGGSHPSLDFFLYRFDSSLGLAPGHSVATLFRKLPFVETASLFTYSGLLIFPPLYRGWACYERKTGKVNLIHAFVVAGASGFVLYQICPAMGPLYAFGSQFPDHLPLMSAVPAKAFASTGVNNAMPSLHMTWVLLVWVAAWELGPFALVIASLVATLTGLATVGFGEHYFIDLIAAAPLTMMVHGICSARHKLTAVGLGLVVAWTAYLRTGIQLPAFFNWSLILVTVITTLFMMRSSLRLTPQKFSPSPHAIDPLYGAMGKQLSVKDINGVSKI